MPPENAYEGHPARTLRRLRERAGFSMERLARAIGYRGASSYQRYEDPVGFRKPYLPMELARKLEGVLVGVGAPPISREEVLALAGVTPPESGPGHDGLAETNTRPARLSERAIPVIDYVAAGRMGDISDPHALGDGFEFATVDRNVGPRAFALEVEGDSMAPEFRNGDIIVVDPDVSYKPGDPVIAKLEGESQAVFKKYRPRAINPDGSEIIELAPINPDYPKFVLGPESPGYVVGKVVRHIRKL